MVTAAGRREPKHQADRDVGYEPGSPPSPRHRRRLVVGGATVGVIAVVVAAILTARTGIPSAPVVEGRGPAPAFELENVRRGEAPVSLAAARGRPVVLNFWASWCVPCRREMPSFQAAHEAAKQRVSFLGVNHQDQRGPALSLLAETGVRYPSGFDPAGEVALAYGLYGMPTTIFISADGEVVGRRTGEMSRTELEATMARLFGEI